MMKPSMILAAAMGLVLMSTVPAEETTWDQAGLDLALRQLVTEETDAGSVEQDLIRKHVRCAVHNPQGRESLLTGLSKVLVSDASLDTKRFACEQLRYLPSATSVSALAPLLTHDELGRHARSALEGIPDPAAGEALRQALGELEGNCLAGVINSLGQRREAQSVEPLGRFISSANERVASAALNALGKIGSPQAAEALQEAAESVPQSFRHVLLDALLQCADRLRASGKTEPARAIYERLSATPDWPRTRAAGLRGLLGTNPGERLGLVQDALQSRDREIHAVAGWFVRRMANDAELKSLAQQLEKCSSTARVVLLHALADRGCQAAAPAAMRLAKDKDRTVRTAALWTLGSVADENAVELLADEIVSTVDEERRAAGHSLVVLCGDPRGSERLLQWIRRSEPALRVKFIRSFADRNATEAGPLVWQIAQEADLATSLEAIKAFGEIAAEEHSVPELLRLFLTATDQRQRSAALDALKHACISARWRSANRPSLHKLSVLIEVVALEIRKAPPPVKCQLLPVLGCLGGQPALIAVRSELRRSEDEAVRMAAIGTLADWRDDAAAAELLSIARESTSVEHRKVAVRGYLRMIDLRKDRSAEETARMCGEALDVVPWKGQKVQLLSRLSRLKHVAALHVVERSLSDPTIRQSACDTAIQIASSLDAENKADIARVLGLVLKISKNSATLKTARDVLNQHEIRPE